MTKKEIRKLVNAAFAAGYNKGCEDTAEITESLEGRCAYPAEYPLHDDGSADPYID